MTETTTTEKPKRRARRKKNGVPGGSMPMIPFDLILADDDANARQIVDGIEELAQDIKANGLLEPIGIKVVSQPSLTEDERELLDLEDDPAYIGRLTYGFRRYYAIQVLRDDDPASFKEVPFVPDEGNDLDSTFKNLNENIARKDLNPGELADAFYKLKHNLGQSIDDICAKIPVYSKAYIQGLISLRKRLTQDAWEEFHGGSLTYDVAREIAKAGSADKQKDVLKAVQKVSSTQEGKKKKRGVKKEAQAASKKAQGKEDAAVRPSLKDVRVMAKKYESEKDLDKQYNKGVHYALQWVMGDRKRLPNLKTS